VSDFQQIFKQFDNLNALIIGDVMIDAYLWGRVERMSPEAPVPVVSVDKEEERLGGAANVVLNVMALGATPIICSVIGNDEKSRSFQQLMKDQQLDPRGIIHSESRVTTVKTRVISDDKHMLRVDQEMEDNLNNSDEAALMNRIREIVNETEINVIIFEDYDKGVITTPLIDQITQLASEKNIPVTVDPKKKNFLGYQNVTLFKPNLIELEAGLDVELDKNDPQAIKDAVKELQSKNNSTISLITLSEKGIYVNSENTDEMIPAHERDILDVSGAGDTVISVASLCLALNLPHKTIAALANLAGGLVCEKVGVVPIDKAQLLDEAEKLLN
jgi:rfaE bifunctional protein kinase chain/domain